MPDTGSGEGQKSMKLRAAAIIAGFIIDMLIGDPRGIPHIVILMGKMISGLENRLRSTFPGTEHGERTAGTVMTAVMAASAVIVGIVLNVLYAIAAPLGFAVETVICWQCVAARDLKKESFAVYDELKKGDLPGARRAVSMIVGRDVERLDETGVTKAAVETIAENTSDGVIAPLFYMMLFGGAGGWLYKAVNTMDSMVGYKNERYINFGRTAARTDDVFNYIPARLAAALMIAAAYLGDFDGPGAVRIFKRDRYKHASPNSAQTESVCAGALNVQLAGDAWYFGELHKKEFIGDPIRQVETEDIRRAARLMDGTVYLMIGLIILLRIVL